MRMSRRTIRAAFWTLATMIALSVLFSGCSVISQIH